ncbi:MAG: hypothetical protein KL863_09040 [Rhizobium sp.]|nr:hypothetical protein [Rhizobium sp.]
MTAHLPVNSPLNRNGLDSSFVARVLGKTEARRLAGLIIDAERDAAARIDTAKREADTIMASARLEAEAILAMLPDFAALEAVPAKRGRTALGVIRGVADKYGFAIAAVTRRSNGQDERHTAVQAEAVRAVAVACPRLSDAEIGALFSSLPAGTVRRYRNEGSR